MLFLKKEYVAPFSTVPNRISVCLIKSSAEFIGFTVFTTVRNAARLAVYELIKIRVKNHHALATRRADADLQFFQNYYKKYCIFKNFIILLRS